MKNVNLLKEVLQHHNTSAPEPDTGPVQLAYLNGLENDIRTTKKFLDQADSATKQIEGDTPLASSSSDTDRKRRILALHASLGKLPYSPHKNDVIGIALASKHYTDAVNAHTTTNTSITKHTRELNDAATDVKALLEDYAQLLGHLDARLESIPTEVAALDAKMADSSEVSVQSQVDALKERISDTTVIDKSIQAHLRRVVLKFLAFQDWANEHVLDEESFKRNIKHCLKIINKLVDNLTESQAEGEEVWLRLEPTSASDEALVSVLLRNELVMSRSDSTQELYFLKLRDYGFDYR